MQILQELGLSTTSTEKSNGEFPSRNPSNGEILSYVSSATEENYEKIIQKSQKAFKKWSDVPAPRRGEIVRLIGNALRAKKDYLGSLVTLEMGKIKQEGDGEVQEMIDIADFAVGQSRMMYGKTMHSERLHHRMYEQWHPLGPIGVISAFNFPVAVWAWNALLAAVCGNTVIWKPSPKTPLCALAVHNICQEVMIAEGYPDVFSLLITDDNQLAQKFVEDKRLPLISFTGSSEVGRKVGAAVSGRLGKCILELGGNNAIIVDETADLRLAVPAIVFGAVGTAGQRCTSTRRVFVHQSRYDELANALKDAYHKVIVGDPLLDDTLMGPLIDEVSVVGFVEALKAVQGNGGEILFGGRVGERKGNFVQPTLIRAHNDWPIVQQETFAPILYLMTYETLDSAIAMQNNVPQGLSSALFTESMRNAEYFLSHLGSDCGIANINIGTSGAEIGGAFGGEKDTGGGRESGSDAWKGYMRRQTNTINWSDELPLAQGIKFDL